METIKGRPVFEQQSYLYIINKESGDKVIWCYCNYCRGRFYTINGQVTQLVGNHNHEPVHSASEGIEARTQMVQGAKKTVNTTYDIVTSGVSKLSDHTITSLPGLQHLKRTFDVVPELYFQLCTIHVTYLNHILPAVYVLLPGKKQSLYKTMFKKLKNLALDLDPLNVMIDFERASINVIKSLFPTSVLNGCFLHLCQNIYRAVARFDLKALYGANENFSKQIRCLPGLAFLPIGDVIPTFEQVKCQFPAEGEFVITYFEEHYIGVKSRLSRPRKLPKFDISL